MEQLWKIGAEKQHLEATGSQPGLDFIQISKLGVAVRTPPASVEDDNVGMLQILGLERVRTAIGPANSEVWCTVPYSEGLSRLSLACKFGSRYIVPKSTGQRKHRGQSSQEMRLLLHYSHLDSQRRDLASIG